MNSSAPDKADQGCPATNAVWPRGSWTDRICPIPPKPNSVSLAGSPIWSRSRLPRSVRLQRDFRTPTPSFWASRKPRPICSTWFAPMPARLLRLLDCEPDRHLAQLIDTTCREVSAAGSEAEAMRSLRRMKSEAALLIALCDIGGVWPVMRVTAALTDLAVRSVQSALRYLLREEAARAKISPPSLD